jgi:hypothetical protein
LRRAASMAHSDLHDIDQAFAWLSDALVAHVDSLTLDALEGLGLEVKDPRRAEESLTHALSDVFDGPLVRQLLARRAKIRREQIGDKHGAATDLKKLHDLSPNDQAVMEELSALFMELDDYRGMVQLYEDQILRGKDMNARAELARKVARMWEEKLADPREAADAWRRVLRMKPGDGEATAGLERSKSNMLKKPDPNDGEAYAPPKFGAVSTSGPPPPASAPPPVSRTSTSTAAAPTVEMALDEALPRPSEPARSAPAYEEPLNAADLLAEAEAEERERTARKAARDGAKNKPSSGRPRGAWFRPGSDDATMSSVLSATTRDDSQPTTWAGSETKVDAVPVDMGDELIAHQMPSAPPASVDMRSTMHEIDPPHSDLGTTHEIAGDPLDTTHAHPKDDGEPEPTEIGSAPAMLVDDDEMIIIAEDEDDLTVDEHHAKTVADEERDKNPHQTDRPRR